MKLVMIRAVMLMTHLKQSSEYITNWSLHVSAYHMLLALQCFNPDNLEGDATDASRQPISTSHHRLLCS